MTNFLGLILPGAKKSLMEMVLRLNAIPIYRSRTNSGVISHKDKNTRNNVLENLKFERITEDIKYVYYVRSTRKWSVQIPVRNNYKNGIRTLGNFDTRKEAVQTLARYIADDLSFGKK